MEIVVNPHTVKETRAMQRDSSVLSAENIVISQRRVGEGQITLKPHIDGKNPGLAAGTIVSTTPIRFKQY